MEKINLREHMRKDDGLSWALLHLITRSGHETEEFKHESGDDLEVHMTINGVEVNFSQILESLMQQHNRMVDERARQIVEELLSPLHRHMEETVTGVREYIEEQIDRKLNQEWWETDDEKRREWLQNREENR